MPKPRPTARTDRTLAASDLINQAVQHHQSGRLQEAEKLYRQILAEDPAHADANHLLGLLAYQGGFLKEAIALISNAIKTDASQAMFHNSLGLALTGESRFDEAVTCFTHALTRKPDYMEAHNNLAGVYLKTGNYTKAIEHFRRVITLKPGHLEAHGNLGNALKNTGNFEAAATCYRTVIEAAPQHPQAHCNLGTVLQELGQIEDAIASYRQAIHSDASHVESYNNLALALQSLGRLDEAIECLQKALPLQPDFAETHSNLGSALQQQGHPGAALPHLQNAIKQAPNHAKAHSNMGAALIELGHPQKAIAHFEKALELQPQFPTAFSNLLLSQLYLSDTDPVKNRDLARQFAGTINSPVLPIQNHPNSPDPNKLLKIGFVSADLRHHSVSYFLASVWPSLNSDTLQVFAYATSLIEDDMSQQLKNSVSVWRNLAGLSTDKQVETIQKDSIDILIDLGGHTAHNSLQLFARKPAPLQVSWLGYSATTGLDAMDYILCDPWVVPESDNSHYVETPWRLPENYLCFSPPNEQVEITELPALANGYLTFGSFNNLTKLSDATVHCWACLLKALPDSRLLLKAKQLDQPDFKVSLIERFKGEGVEEDQLIFTERTKSLAAHFATYNEIDIALDPFPYGGTTTSAEALWMGVPVLTLKGDRFVGHVGESLLQNINLADWIADSPDDYIEKAVTLSQDLPALMQLCSQLREQFIASPICDAPRFSVHLQKAFRNMWEIYCQTRPQVKG